jgi:hypothetical protein
MDVIRGFAQHHLKERKKKGQKIKGFEKKECNRISMCTRSIIQFPTSTTAELKSLFPQSEIEEEEEQLLQQHV